MRLVFICLDTRGGHGVPDPDVLSNLAAALKIVDEAVGYDNSGLSPRKTFEARQGVITWRGSQPPAWFAL